MKFNEALEKLEEGVLVKSLETNKVYKITEDDNELKVWTIYWIKGLLSYEEIKGEWDVFNE